jgi:putative oxidoreductase
MKLFILVARLLLGGLFFGHGAQKLFGWFGGYGPDGTGGFFESIGVKPGRQHAMAAGASEMGGGALLAAGLATPAAAAAITGVMTTAIRTVHQPNGPWITENGWEYTAVVIATVLTIVEVGPGPVSLDAALGTERKGPGWALAALLAGVGGSALALRDWERPAPAPEGAGDAS